MLYEFQCQCGKSKTVQRLVKDMLLPCSCECGKQMKRNYKVATNVILFKPVWNKDITGEPILIESKRQLAEECAKHGCVSNYERDGFNRKRAG
jgi:hypothetical protein